MKWLIVSKEKAGQKELKEKMKKEYGWVFAASYTTKESKNTGDEEHVITKALASDIPDEEKAYITTIAAQDGMDTDEEFVTRKGMETAKACIVRPDEAYQILENMPDEDFGIIYLTSLGLQPGVVDTSQRQNCWIFLFFSSNSSQEALQYMAKEIEYTETMLKRMICIVTMVMKKTDALTVTEDGKIVVFHKNGTWEMTPERFAAMTLMDKEGFDRLMWAYIGR